MAWFRRKREESPETDPVPEPGAEEGVTEGAQAPDAAGTAEADGAHRGGGPKDSSEVDTSSGYIDFGSMLIPTIMPMQFHLNGPTTGRTGLFLKVVVRSSALELRLSAAPVDNDTWSEVRAELIKSVQADGVKVKEGAGRWGPELLVVNPVVGPGGQKEYFHSRVLGFNGPRWFLRVQIIGPAATDVEEFKALIPLIEQLVVERGDKPMPPGGYLPFTLPTDVPAAGQGAEA